MDIIHTVFGEGKDLNILQMCSRTLVVYFLALAMIRISGRRTFGKRSAFDNTVAIMLGAILSRAIVGASPFVTTIGSCMLLVLLHRLLAWASSKNEWLSNLIKGVSLPLYLEDKVLEDNLTKSLLSKKDLMADVRLNGNINSLDGIQQIYMETSGEVSIVKKT